jgi:hypothetical protein
LFKPGENRAGRSKGQGDHQRAHEEPAAQVVQQVADDKGEALIHGYGRGMSDEMAARPSRACGRRRDHTRGEFTTDRWAWEIGIALQRMQGQMGANLQVSEPRLASRRG